MWNIMQDTYGPFLFHSFPIPFYYVKKSVQDILQKFTFCAVQKKEFRI